MPMHTSAWLLLDGRQELQLAQQAHSSRAPADEIFHATMVVHSWDDLRTCPIAQELGCHSRIVRDRLPAFNARGLDRLGMKP
jgi:hypothetical protein